MALELARHAYSLHEAISSHNQGVGKWVGQELAGYPETAQRSVLSLNADLYPGRVQGAVQTPSKKSA